MRKSYDFRGAIKNPYLKNLKKSVTIQLDEEVVLYFQNLANEKGVHYQSLINLYLKDCMENNREPSWSWE